ncbi:hypothetical protein HG530_001203 [Fusarium avenaceum]|nr:hypothetical protein HG530_001203 [Fusarium avenaceum]
MCSLLCVQNPIIFSFRSCDLFVSHFLAEPAQRLDGALHPHSDSGVENKAFPDLGDIHLLYALVVLFPSVRRDLLWSTLNRVAALGRAGSNGISQIHAQALGAFLPLLDLALHEHLKGQLARHEALLTRYTRRFAEVLLSLDLLATSLICVTGGNSITRSYLFHLGFVARREDLDCLGDISVVAVQTRLLDEPQSRGRVTRSHGCEELLALGAWGTDNLSTLVEVLCIREDVNCAEKGVVVREEDQTRDGAVDVGVCRGAPEHANAALAVTTEANH